VWGELDCGGRGLRPRQGGLEMWWKRSIELGLEV